MAKKVITTDIATEDAPAETPKAATVLDYSKYAGVYNATEEPHVHTYFKLYAGTAVVTTRAIADSLLEDFPDQFVALEDDVVRAQIKASRKAAGVSKNAPIEAQEAVFLHGVFFTDHESDAADETDPDETDSDAEETTDAPVVTE